MFKRTKGSHAAPLLLNRHCAQSIFVAVTSICIRLVLLMSSTVLRMAGLPGVRSAHDSVRVVRRNGAARPAFPVALAICSGRIKLLISISQWNCNLRSHLFLHGTVNPQSDINIRILLISALSAVVIGTFVETRMLEG